MVKKILLCLVPILILSCVKSNSDFNLTNNDKNYLIGIWSDSLDNKNSFGKTLRFYRQNIIAVKASQKIYLKPGDVSREEGFYSDSADNIKVKLNKQYIIVIHGGKPIPLDENTYTDYMEEIVDVNKEVIIEKAYIKDTNTKTLKIDQINYYKVSDDPFEP